VPYVDTQITRPTIAGLRGDPSARNVDFSPMKQRIVREAKGSGRAQETTVGKKRRIFVVKE